MYMSYLMYQQRNKYKKALSSECLCSNVYNIYANRKVSIEKSTNYYRVKKKEQ